jgi:cytochrome c-type biogenesis protein CcmH/NrfG
MKPRFLCTECEKEIPWGVQACPNCGKTVEWPEDSASVAEENIGSTTTPCPTCGIENASDASFCGSCGARLKKQAEGTDSKQQRGKSRPSAKQGKTKGEKRSEASSNPMFSWKVIFGFLGILVIFVLVVELFPSHDQPTSQPTVSSPQAPAANMQLMNQIAELEKRVDADPNDTQALLALANACQDGKFLDKAIVQYKKYLQKNPRDANARVDLGICYFETSNLVEAQKEMETALKYDSKHVAGHFNLGIVNLRAGKVKEANEWFKKTIALAPNSDMGQQAKQILEQHSSPLIQNK